MKLEDDPMFAALKEEKPPPKEIVPLSQEDTELYLMLFFQYLNSNP